MRPDGRPHVTPLIGVWVDGALHIVTGPTERKARNLAANPHTTVTTGTNALDTGLDVVVEGEAERLTDAGPLQRVADAYVAKYGEDWQFTVKDGGFVHDGHEALVLRADRVRLRQEPIRPDPLALRVTGATRRGRSPTR